MMRIVKKMRISWLETQTMARSALVELVKRMPVRLVAGAGAPEMGVVFIACVS